MAKSVPASKNIEMTLPTTQALKVWAKAKLHGRPSVTIIPAEAIAQVQPNNMTAM